MPDEFATEERSYRRGLVLGLTMAEIMILILFALLLIWMIGLQERERLLEKANVAVKQAKDAVARTEQLKEELARFTESPDRANAFDDQFRELVIAKQQIAGLQAEVAALRESTKILDTIAKNKADGNTEKTQIEEIERRLQIAERLLNNMRRANSDQFASLSEQELSKETASLLSLQEQLRARGSNPAEIGKLVEECKRKAEDSEAQVKTLQGRLLNFQQKLAALGKGTEKPACWANPWTGKPEYIFDIALQSTAVRVHDNALPNRERDQAKLPLAGVQFNRSLGLNEFRTATRPLFQWSEKEGCRFFVRVIDETAAHEKAKYKLVLRTVQEHFYTFEDLNPTQ